MKISIVSPCYNESENIQELYDRIKKSINGLDYCFEIIFIDNASTDGTQDLIKRIAANDNDVKLIINTRNFGWIRSPYWGILQASGDAVVYLASDLQDPPELIPQFIAEWSRGEKIVLATKPVSGTNKLMHGLRRAYYKLLDKIADVAVIKDATGFGIYDKVVIDKIREINDPYPYFRGLICELGYSVKTLDFNQPARLRGLSKNNFYALYDVAILGLISHSRVPIRLATFVGVGLGTLSILSSIVVLVLKLLFWNAFPMGIAPIMILLLLMFGLVFIFIGLLGEYIGSIHGYLQNRPIVVEKERINF